MGNQVSVETNINQNNIEKNEQIILNNLIIDEFNWIPSFNILKKKDTNPDKNDQFKDIDLRDIVPLLPDSIVNKNNLQVISMSVLLIQYYLIQGNLSEVFLPSPFFIKYLLNQRLGINKLMNFEHINSIINEYGICPISLFKESQNEVSPSLLENAKCYKSIKLIYVPYDLYEIQSLLNNQHPLLVGFPVYSNFLNTRTNPNLSIPDENDILLGGISGIIVGFIENKRKFIILTNKNNSWGESGFIYVNYKYFEIYGIEIYRVNLNNELINLCKNEGKNEKIYSNKFNKENREYKENNESEEKTVFNNLNYNI